MKVAIIADSHGNLKNTQTALEMAAAAGAGAIIHCGDVGGGEILEAMALFPGAVFIVWGNADRGYFTEESLASERLGQVKFFGSPDSGGGEWGSITLGGKIIAFVHLPAVARELAQSQNYDLVFYGHTHRPAEERIGRTRVVNPGNLAGLYFHASFAIYDSAADKLELKIL